MSGYQDIIIDTYIHIHDRNLGRACRSVESILFTVIHMWKVGGGLYMQFRLPRLPPVPYINTLSAPEISSFAEHFSKTMEPIPCKEDYGERPKMKLCRFNREWTLLNCFLLLQSCYEPLWICMLEWTCKENWNSREACKGCILWKLQQLCLKLRLFKED